MTTAELLARARIGWSDAFCDYALDTMPLLLDVLERAAMVVQWADNVAEWPVPPPLNEELRDLAIAIETWKAAQP